MDGLLHQGHNLEPDIIQEIHHKIQTLQTHRSCVVVFGETSAVTNHFVKCLLEEVNMGAHPSVHKFMEHSFEKDAKHGDEDVRRPYSLVHHSPSKSISKAKISHRRRRLPLEDSRESDPGNILQENVNLLVLPEIVDDDVMSDVESAPPTAFVFLLDEVQAGVHQEDKVKFQQVISTFHQMCSRDDSFDPAAAMFVIHAENFPPETQFFKSYVSERLQRIWPGVCDRQVHLETFCRISEMESPYDSSNTLMDAFYSMIQETEMRQIRQTYVWLKSAIPSSTAYIRSLIGQCVRADVELEPYHGAASRRQERLMVAFTDGIQQLEESVEKQTQKLKESILRCLDTASDNVKKELKGFKLRADKTTEENSVGRGVQHDEIDLVILNSLLGELSKADAIRDIVTATELGLLNVIQTQFDLLDHDFAEIVRNAVCIERERNSEFEESTVDNTEEKQLLWAITRDQILISHSVLDILRSDKKAAGGRVETSEQLGDHWSLNDGRHEGRATMDDELFVMTRVHQLTIRVKDCGEALNAVIEDHLAGARAYVASAKYKIARILSDDVTVVEDLCSCRETFQRGKAHLVQVMEELEPIRSMLEEFGTNFMEDESSYSVNMSQGEIVLTPFRGRSDLWETQQDSLGELCTDGDRNYFKGLWCRSQRTSVTINNQQEKVLLRSYSQEMGKKVLISEVAQLRCLESSFTAPFFGVLGKLTSGQDEEVPVWNGQLSGPWPVLIFRGDLVPCRMFMSILDQSTSDDSRSGCPAADSRAEFVMAFVASLLAALDYIHKHGLVHMELTLDTVMVERTTGEVKLCHICKPRKSTVPKNTSVVKAGPYLCLAPRVLRGDIYEPADDIYAFGLLLWELLYPHKPPYSEQRSWTLETFIDRCSTTEILQSDLIMLGPSEGVYKILSGSLQFDKENFIESSAAILRQWRDLEDTSNFQKMTSTLVEHNQLPNLDSPNKNGVQEATLANQDYGVEVATFANEEYFSGDVTIGDIQPAVLQTLGENVDVNPSSNHLGTEAMDIANEPNLICSPDNQKVGDATHKQTSNRQESHDTTSSLAQQPSSNPEVEAARPTSTREAPTEVVASGDQDLTSQNRRKERGAQTFSETPSVSTSFREDSLSRLRKDDLERRHSLSSDAPDQIARMLASTGGKSQKPSGNLFFRLFKKMTPSRSYDFDHVYDETPQPAAGKLRLSRSERGARVIPDNDEVVRRSLRSKSNSRTDIKVLSFRISQEM